MTATLLASWLLTYLLHSTIFLCAALVVTRIRGDRRLAAQETLLRAALVGGIVTAILQISLGISPLAGVVALDTVSQTPVSTPIETVADSDARIPLSASAAATQDRVFGWEAALIILWGLASILALLAVLRSILDLNRLLQTRCFRPAGRLVENLAAAMGLRKPVKFSTSKAIAVPFATGIREPEICCPERVEELAREHRTSLFAHELAHLARRDPAWQLLYRLGEALLVLQPLNRLVRRRLEEIAEHLTDERAVACTGDRLGLARCLVVVAHWGISSPVGLPATAFAAGPRLDRRVRRLISGITDQGLATRWAFLLVGSLLMAAVAILPVVGTTSAHAEQAVAPIGDATWTISAEESESDSPVVEGSTWSILDDRPANAPQPPPRPAQLKPVARAPESEVPPSFDLPEPAVAPRPNAVAVSSTPPRPASEPKAAASAQPVAPAETDELPTPAEEPAPSAAPTPPEAPEDLTPEETARRHYEREHERAEAHERQHEEKRAHAEDRARTRERAQAERCREREIRTEEIEARRPERIRQLEVEREALREQLQQLRTETEFMVQEEVRAAAERSRALAREASALNREASKRNEELSEEQREEYRLKALQLRAEAEAQRQEATRNAHERARELSEKTRRIVAEAEAERRTLEELEEREKPQ